LTFELGIIILQGVSRRKSLAGVNIMQGRKFANTTPQQFWEETALESRALHSNPTHLMFFLNGTAFITE
jgi:hypothetical protein